MGYFFFLKSKILLALLGSGALLPSRRREIGPGFPSNALYLACHTNIGFWTQIMHMYNRLWNTRPYGQGTNYVFVAKPLEDCSYKPGFDKELNYGPNLSFLRHLLLHKGISLSQSLHF